MSACRGQRGREAVLTPTAVPWPGTAMLSGSGGGGGEFMEISGAWPGFTPVTAR